MLAGQAVALALFSAVIPVEIVFVKETLGGSDAGYGLLLGSWGVGMVAGGVLFARAGRASLIGLLLVSTLAIGAAYLGMAASPTLAWACAASIVGGVGNGVQWVALVTALQEAVERRALQARVMGMLESLAQLMPGIGFLLGGVVATLASPRTVYAIAGAGVMLLVAAAALAAGRRRIPGAWATAPAMRRSPGPAASEPPA